ncbi:DKNYY domain-containing protein [Dickeya dadantii]|uniref:DKNYY domain-containing protein n=1 Tax=Dickeya dadantii TaxID=204038 RepID=UPI001CF2C4B0|nr:DKNYY domain-containing protein [Dickeya dadantii]MCA7013947.1 DKNYY domain-containing protein [Dickeya dadantii]
MKRNGYLALLLGMAALSSQAEVKPPYQVEQGKVVYRVSVNADPQVLAEAKPQDFRVLLREKRVALAVSGHRYYCNQQPLPDGFKPESARLRYDSFLISNVGSYVGCERMKQDIDIDSFQALDFPFFRDRNHVWLPDGEELNGVDIASFKTLARNQAFDKQNYYFVENETSVIPYQKSAPSAGSCFGWATIDGNLYYRGEQRADGDAASFRCLTFSTALDKNGFYVFGRPYQGLPAGVKAADIRMLPNNEKLATDGEHIWFLGVEPVQLAGLSLRDVRVVPDANGYTISDGKTRWLCGSGKVNGRPLCRKG